MTIEELIDRLKRIKERAGDQEADHANADTALLDFINDAKVTEIYNSIDKWYA